MLALRGDQMGRMTWRDRGTRANVAVKVGVAGLEARVVAGSLHHRLLFSSVWYVCPCGASLDLSERVASHSDRRFDCLMRYVL